MKSITPKCLSNTVKQKLFDMLMNKRVDAWLTMIQHCNLSFSIINLSGKTWETARSDLFPPGETNKNAAFHKCCMRCLSLVRQSNAFRTWRSCLGWRELLDSSAYLQPR